MTHDYSPCGTPRDLPGDPGRIRLLGRRYLDTADEIVATADRLQRMGRRTEAVWKGLAGREFPAKARDLSSRIRKAETRYRETGEALTRFADRADQAQDDAARAASRARAAQSAMVANQPRPVCAGAVTTPEADAADLARAEAYRQASVRYQQACAAFADAKADYDAAAREARDRIHRASHDDGLRDSWFYRNFERIAKIIAIIAIVVLVISVICLLLPVLVGGAPLVVAIAGMVGIVAQWAGVGLALFSLGWNIGGRAAGHDVSALTIALDAVAVVTFGMSRFFLAPRLARVETAALVNRGLRVTARSMGEFDTFVRRSPTLLHYLARESLRPVALRLAVTRGFTAIDDLDSALALAARHGDSVAVRLLLRDDPTDLLRLARLARFEPAFAKPIATLVRVGVVNGVVQDVTDVASVTNTVLETRETAVVRETTEQRADAITETVHQYVLSTP